MTGRLALRTLFLLSGWMLAAARADDQARYYDAQGEVAIVRGTIQRVDARQLVIQDSLGRRTTLPLDQIIQLDGGWGPAIEATRGDTVEDLRGRLERVQQAYQNEQRLWARQWLLAEASGIHRELGDWVRSAELFTAATRDGPVFFYLDRAPLVWQTASLDGAAERWAAARLDAEDNHIRLLAASWLLSGGETFAARRTLEDLANGDSPVGQLAKWQLRRLTLVQASAAELSAWQAELEALPGRLRAGPYFLLGKALARHQQPLKAAVSFLRVPFLYNQHRGMAAEALFLAAQQLEQHGRIESSILLYRDLIERHSDSPLAEVARRRLAEIGPLGADARRSAQGTATEP